MNIDYIHAHSLGALYLPLSRQLHAERLKLLPQTPQTIVVGNLDTEGYLQRRLVEEDGVLMGVNFPFLESAIESFSARIRQQAAPKVNESWFTPPAKSATENRSLTIFDLEMVMLGILQNPAHERLLESLGYRREQLTPVRMIALSQKLAGEWYDYLLHVPDRLAHLPAHSPAASLWNLLQKTLLGAGYTSLLPGRPIFTGIPQQTLGQQSGLILFGMPLLSAYHLRVIAEIARVAPVTLYATDFSDLADAHDSLLQAIGRRYRRYRAAFEVAAKGAGVNVAFTATAEREPLTKTVQIAALPGLWRASEIIGDICHATLIAANLRQTDISVALHNPDAQFAAFEKSLAMRTLTASCRSVAAEAPDSLIELWQIIATAIGSGIDRETLLRFWQNPVFKEVFQVSDEEISDYKLALERAQGFRSDYQGDFGAYSLESATNRFAHSTFFETHHSSRQPLRLFDSPERTEHLLKGLHWLKTTCENLGRLNGPQLFEAMRQALLSQGFDRFAASEAFLEMLSRIEEVDGSEFFTLSQIVAAIERHAAGNDLRFSQRADGIAFTPPGATAYTRRMQVIFDLNDKVTARDDEVDFMIPEFRDAPTRLSPDDQLTIALVHAIFGGSDSVILAYSNIDAKTGAEFYPSQVLARFEKSLHSLKVAVTRAGPFTATVLDAQSTDFPPAADDDIKTIQTLERQRSQARRKLTDLLLPEEFATGAPAAYQLRELHTFLMNPVLHILSQRVTLPEEPAEFGFTEPLLAVGKSARTRFCEEYVEETLALGKRLQSPIEFVTRKQKMGELPAGGFDQALRLLEKNENARRLMDFAETMPTRYRRVEIIFADKISNTFTKRDSGHVDRYYVPAPEIAGVTITGQIENLWLDTSTGLMTRIASGIYKRRIPQILELHLALCLLKVTNAGSPPVHRLAYTEFAIDSPKKTPDRLEFEMKEICDVDLGAFDCQGYLSRLLEALAAREVFWFDLQSLNTVVFANLANQTEKQLISSHEFDSEFSKRPARSVFLKRFFDLSADRRSLEFFDTFIRPLAAANASASSETGKQKTRKNK